MTVTCKTRPTTFNTETEQQWKLNQHQLLEEEFVNAVNFFHNIQNSELSEDSSHQTTPPDTEKLNDNHEDLTQGEKEEVKDDLEEVDNLIGTHKSGTSRRKSIRLCQHKLQRRALCHHKHRTKRIQPQGEFWPQPREENWREELRHLELSQDPEWDQLWEAEEYLRQQREKLQ